MKKVISGLSLMLVFSGVAMAQTANSNLSSSADGNTSINKTSENIILQSGTQIAAQLQNKLDVQKANIGDQVVLKTTSAIKQNGQVIVEKGSRLIGRVTEVQQKAKGSATSKIGILFERIENGQVTLPIEAVISSITQAQSRSNIGDTIDSDISGNSSSSGSARSQGSGGGLLGGTGGGLLGGVTNTVGSVVNTTTQTIGSSTSRVGETISGTIRGLQITQSATGSAEGSSTLVLAGDNLRLEKGTTFNLSLSQSNSKNSN